MRVAFVLRSAEIQPLLLWFVMILIYLLRIAIVISYYINPPQHTYMIIHTTTQLTHSFLTEWMCNVWMNEWMNNKHIKHKRLSTTPILPLFTKKKRVALRWKQNTNVTQLCQTNEKPSPQHTHQLNTYNSVWTSWCSCGEGFFFVLQPLPARSGEGWMNERNGWMKWWNNV